MKYIYLYTTKTYRANDWYKIGESKDDPVLRVQQQDNSSNPEKLELIHAWLVREDVTDKKVHNQLEKMDFNRLRTGREWFELSENPVEDVSEAINKITTIIQEFKEDTLQDIKFCKSFKVPNYNEMWWWPC